MSKVILGISAFYHDSAAALVVDGVIVAAAQEERFTRDKHTPDFPVKAIQYCLEEGGYAIDELDGVVFYDKPLLKFERLLETYYAFAPKGLVSFLKAIPVWLREKLFLKKMLLDGLKEVGDYDKKQLRLLFPEHHLSHAASAFYPSSFEKAAIMTIDGVGEWTTASIGLGEGNKISIIKEMKFPHSVGLLYSAFTYYLGFKVNSGEYKLMGLAPYGNHGSEEVERFKKLIRNQLIDIKEDGSVWLDQSYFNYATGLRMIREPKWEALFGLKTRKSEAEIEQVHCNMALAIQEITEEVVLKMAKTAKELTGARKLCLAGGVALNCVANGKLLKEGIFDEVFIQPASGDAGGSVGAALAAYYIYFDEDRQVMDAQTGFLGSYLGPEYSDKEIQQMNKRVKANFQRYDDFDALTGFISEKLKDGMVVGWFQGRMEFGPRALGNRSIIADPRNSEMQKKLNLKIKYREGFRPFAPSVLVEDKEQFFDLQHDSPYMLLVSPVNEQIRKPRPDGYDQMNLWERLYTQRSSLPSITHMDYSARVQTVHKETNPRYWDLLNAFKKKTDVGVLINTSFNVRGEPIVCTPHDAYRCFMSTEMDYLVINDFVYCKTEQPNWEDKSRWITNFKMD